MQWFGSNREMVLASLGGWLGAAALAVAAQGAVGVSAEAAGARAQLRDTTGQVVGTVRFTEANGSTLVKVEASHLAPGFHGFHVHAVGECVAPFMSAGAHLDVGGHGHSTHAGDLPVLLVNGDGTGEARFATSAFTLRDLLDADGSAVIVHAQADNYANIPARYDAGGPDATTLATGDAGPRTACGVVQRAGRD